MISPVTARSALNRLAAAALIGLASVPQDAASQPLQAVAAPPTSFAEASQLFRAGRYAAAYGRFVRLANEGDREAARVALVMHRHGRELFGSVWDASTEELEQWSLLAQSADLAEVEARVRIGLSAKTVGGAGGEAAYLAPGTFRSDKRKKR